MIFTRAYVHFLLSLALIVGLFFTPALTNSTVSAAGIKVAIIVGPVGSMTAGYRNSADQVAAAAQAQGATVAKAYSPNATWDKVKAATNGANIIVYFGHGNGFPNPYTTPAYTSDESKLLSDRANGWGLNRTTTNGDADNWGSTLVYCGEDAITGSLTSASGSVQRQYCATGPITPAPGFVMIYSNAHYAPGFGESYTLDDPVATQSQAHQRVSLYSRKVFKLNGGAYYAMVGGADKLVTDLLSVSGRTYGDHFKAQRAYSAADLKNLDHPKLSGTVHRVWIQRTIQGNLHDGRPDYWYAFAGNPAATFGGATSTTPPPPPPPSGKVERWAGADRYTTAAQITKNTGLLNVPVVFIATGANFPDALSGGAAAIKQKGLILLSLRDSLPAATVTELQRMRPGRIVVLGGTGVISDRVLTQLRNYTSGSVTRQAGLNRYATSAAISAGNFAPGVSRVYIATGSGFPDALAGVPVSSLSDGPVLLVDGSIPSVVRQELSRLKPGQIVILGGTGVVNAGVESALRGYATSVVRWAGADRYKTAISITSNNWSSTDTLYVGTGVNFPDALAGGPAAGSSDDPLLLVPGGSLTAELSAEIKRLNPSRVIILGGTGVVSTNLAGQISNLLK